MRTRVVRRLIACAAASALVACGGGGGGGGGGSNALRFFVASTSPADGANGVSTDAHVFVTFSGAVDASSVGPQAVRVGILGEGDVPATVGFVQGSDRVLEFAPTEPFDTGTSYAIDVSAAIRSTLGETLGGVRQFTFRTSGTPGGGGGGVDIPPATALRETAGMLNVGRRLHTATGLLDGRILLLGGFEAGTRVTDRAETYSQTSERFTLLVARMTAPRANHASVRLSDGRVLLCGGYREAFPGNLVSTATAEVFDPATDTFAATGDMGSERVDHTATLLPDGRVLVVGGSRLVNGNVQDLVSVELYDPTAGTFAPAPTNLVHTHATHATVNLGDGRLLVVGGSDADTRPELYAIASGTFTPIAAPASDRGRFGAAVARYPDGDVTVVGGEAFGQVLHFDLGTSTLFDTASPTTQPRQYATATAIGFGRVLVAGGVDIAGGFLLATCDLVVQGGPSYSSTYATPVRFPVGLAFHTATPLGSGRILFAGGLNPTAGQPELRGAYLFTP